MLSFQPGDVVLIRFPFTDLVGVKRRPALVLLDTGDEDILAALITTQPRQTQYDCKLEKWAEAGLKALPNEG
jgi:mRNA interferase MazF